MIDQSLSHAQLSTDGRLISLKICSVLGRQRKQTPLLGDSASAVVPSVTFHGWKINTNNGAVIKTAAESLSYENIPIIFKMASLLKVSLQLLNAKSLNVMLKSIEVQNETVRTHGDTDPTSPHHELDFLVC